MPMQPKGDRDPDGDQGDPPPVNAWLTFAVAAQKRRTIYQMQPGMPPTRPDQYASQLVDIRDVRPGAPFLSLDREGFVLVNHETAVINFDDPEEIEAVYYREAERAVRSATGARAVLAFDHNIRFEGGAGRVGLRNAVRVAHNDYTEKSGPRRAQDLLPPDDAALVLAGRFAVINLWRPIAGPVEQWPLALADAQSVAPETLIPTDLVYPDRVGEIYELAYCPRHRWFYAPNMQPDEALIIKCFDSRSDGAARFVPHAAFDHPATTTDAAPRHSIEVRTLAYYGP